MRHTYVTMQLSLAAYDEIAANMRAAGYYQAFYEDGVIDMHGIAVQPEPMKLYDDLTDELKPCPECRSDYLRVVVYPPAPSKNNTETMVRVECADCQFCGPLGERQTIHSAMAAWNTIRIERRNIMKCYIGTKIIAAEPQSHEDGREGYRVVYPDGYVSWSPKETFEQAYRRVSDDERRLQTGAMGFHNDRCDSSLIMRLDEKPAGLAPVDEP